MDVFIEKNKGKGFIVNGHELIIPEAKLINDVPDIKRKRGKYVVPPQLFIQFNWSASNCQNVKVLMKVASFQIMWDSEYNLILGAELTSNFIEEYNEVITREPKVIKHQGMECALQ